MEVRDDERIWRAIYQREELGVNHNEDQGPTDQEFKESFENALNLQTNLEIFDDLRTDVNVPILDEPITAMQVEQKAKLIKYVKACGLDGYLRVYLRLSLCRGF